MSHAFVDGLLGGNIVMGGLLIWTLVRNGDTFELGSHMRRAVASFLIGAVLSWAGLRLMLWLWGP